MNIKNTDLEGVYLLEQSVFKDARGAFVKIYQNSFFGEHGLEGDFKECYYTRSKEEVVRGMHFQSPPADHAKLVTVISGTILDVVLDIRRASPTYGKYETFELSRENGKSIYIPRGFAHGFTVLGESAVACYMVTSEYSPENDMGIRYDSFGFKWPVFNPIVSSRDLSFPSFVDFKSPF